MPVDYSKAKIYCIRSPNTDLIYIGSTVQQLSQRMTSHRSSSNKSTSKIMIEHGDAYIELLENFPCANKEELLRKEGEYIRKENCCNKQVADRTTSEYYQDNKEELLEKSKKYYEENKEAIAEKRKIFYEANKDKITEQKRKTYHNKKNIH